MSDMGFTAHQHKKPISRLLHYKIICRVQRTLAITTVLVIKDFAVKSNLLL